jgi:hypothetical protein
VQYPTWTAEKIDDAAVEQLEKKYKMRVLDLYLVGWDAHHIHPRDWNGTDATTNWQYLKERSNNYNPKTNEHSPFTTWWDTQRKPDIEQAVE